MEPWRAGLTALFVLIDAAAIILNMSILIVTLKTAHLRQTLGNNFVINLLSADLLVTLVVMPMWIINFSKSYWIFPELACDVYGYLNAVVSYDTIWTTCLISCDRYYSIAYPSLHAVNLTLSRSLVAILATWILSGFCAALPTIYHEDSKQVYQVLGPLCVNSYEKDDDNDLDVQWVIIGVLCYCLPATILLLSYCAVFRIARKIKMRVVPKRREPVDNSEVSIIPYNPSIWPSQQVTVKQVPAQPSIVTSSKRLASTRTNVKKYIRVGKAARTVVCISGLFIGLWMPYFVSVFYGATHCSFRDRQTVEMVSTWLAFLTYLANPIVYGHFNQPIRYEFRRWVCGRSKPEVDDDVRAASSSEHETIPQFLETNDGLQPSRTCSNDDDRSDKF